MAFVTLTFMVVLSQSFLLGVKSCPSQCQCTSLGLDGIKVDCSNRQLRVIPDDIPSGTTQLFARQNEIKALNTLTFMQLTRLKTVDLRDNQITTVPNDLFRFTPQLNQLKLDGNPLLCNCDLYGLFNISKIIHTFSGSCANLNGTSLQSLKLHELCGGCKGIKVSGKGNSDGEYLVGLTFEECHAKVQVYCHAMSSDNPKEYISLISGTQENFAYIYDRKLPESDKNQCTYKTGGGTYDKAGLTNFTRVRLDLQNMSIITYDYEFASHSGMLVPYGVAGDCYSASTQNCRKGQLKIDLRGTSFRIKEGVNWVHYGSPSYVTNTLDIDEDRQRVHAVCGGYCGGCKPNGPLKLSIASCETDEIKSCEDALGMQYGFIPDSSITASSTLSDAYAPKYGRLHSVFTVRGGGAWCSATTDSNQYLQIDLAKVMTIAGIATQGRQSADSSKSWIIKYKIWSKGETGSFVEYKEFSNQKTFQGNTDSYSVVTNWLNQRFRARYVQIRPVSWNNRICLRVELYGCKTDLVSVKILSTVDNRCWGPLTGSDACETADGTSLGVTPYCNQKSAMFKFLRGNILIHSCTGKCVHIDGGYLKLKEGPCTNRFIKEEKSGDSVIITEATTEQCVSIDTTKKDHLKLSGCGAQSSFKLSQDGLTPIKPSFKDKAETAYLRVGFPGWLTCTVIADPRAKIFWSKGKMWPDGQLNEFDFIQFSNGSVFAKTVRQDFEGLYYCTAVNSGGYHMKTLSVEVGASPQFTRSPNNTKGILNRTALFNCQASAVKFPVKIFWVKMEKVEAVKVTKLSQRFTQLVNGSLLINRVQKSDEGYYKCNAENHVGIVTATAYLRVLIPPRFVIIPTSFETPSGSSPLVTCQATGDPSPSIGWKKDKLSPLPSGFKVYNNGSLLMKLIQKKDEGKYICYAFNDADKVFATITVAVYVACRIDPPANATINPANKTFYRVDESVSIGCKKGFELARKDEGNLTCQRSGTWNKPIPRCRDINECDLIGQPTVNYSCHNNATCHNTVGSYYCRCEEGYAGDGKNCSRACSDPPTPKNGKWQSNEKYFFVGSVAYLRCDQGFNLSDSQVNKIRCKTGSVWSQESPSCVDIDECNAANGKPCHSLAICQNTAGSYKCSCVDGYEGDGYRFCRVEKNRIIKGPDGRSEWEYSKRMDVLDEKLKQLSSDNVTSEEVLELLTNVTSPRAETLVAGDLMLLVSGMTQLVDKQNKSTNRMAKKQNLKTFVGISSNLLDNRNKEEWEKVQKETKGVTEIMRLLDRFAKEVASELYAHDNGTVEIASDNLVLKLSVAKATDLSDGVTFPDDSASESSKSSKEDAQILVPRKIFLDFKKKEVSKPIEVIGIVYNSLGNLLPNRAQGVEKYCPETVHDFDQRYRVFEVNTKIVSITLEPSPLMSDGKTVAPIKIILKGKPIKKDGVASCVYWDFNQDADLGGSWSSRGCRLTSNTQANGTVCECDHLTSFSSIAIYDKELKFTIVIYIGCGILIVAALIAFIKHACILCKRKSERAIIHLNLCFVIAAGIGLFLGGLLLTQIEELCIVIATFLQFFFISMFCWMMVEGLQLYLTLITGKNKNPARTKYFYIVGYLIPVIAVGISLGATQLRGYGNTKWCWLDYSNVLMWAFVGPAAAMIFVFIIFFLLVLCLKTRVVDSEDRRKITVSLVLMMLLVPVMAGTWVVAAIYVKHHVITWWEYVFAACCAVQGILLLVFSLLDREIKNFTYYYQIKKMQHKEKRNYYSTTDTVQYYGSANQPDGKNYTVTRPSIKESNQDLRGSSKRLSRLESVTAKEGDLDSPEYPSPILDTPASVDTQYRRNIEDQPIPETEAVQMQSLQRRLDYADTQSRTSTLGSVSERKPDGAEETDTPVNGSHRVHVHKNSSSPRSLEMQQIPEQEPLIRQDRGSENPASDADSSKPAEMKGYPVGSDDKRAPVTQSLDSSKRRSQRSRRRLEAEFGKTDSDSIKRRRKLRYSSGYLMGVTLERPNEDHAEKAHASL